MRSITDNRELKALAAELTAGRTIRSVYFVGCGASRSDLYPAWYFLNQKARVLRASLHTANEFVYAPMDGVDETAVVITCSLSGTTPETVKATSVAKARGAVTIAVTHESGSAMTKDADAEIVFGWDSSYGSKEDKAIKVLLLAAELLNLVEGYADYEKMIEASEKIGPVIDKAAAAIRPEAQKFAAAYKDVPLLYVTSSGAMQETAWSFAACLMMEMQWIPASTFNDGDFFHGPFEMVEENAAYLLLMNDGSTRPMDIRALTFMQRFGAKVTVIDAMDYGLSRAAAKEVRDYFNPILVGGIIRCLAEELAEARNHPLSKRRYMWKLEY